MKKYDYLYLGAISLLSHIAQGAAFVLLFAAFGGTGSTSSFTFATPVGLVLGVIYVAGLSFLFGWGLRPEKSIDKNRCWNAAMVLYVLNLASLLAHPTVLLSFGGGFGSVLAVVWELSLLPALAGAEALLSGARLYVALVFLAAVEPMCLTLGLLWKGKKSGGEKQTENPARPSADAEAAMINEENNTNA